MSAFAAATRDGGSRNRKEKTARLLCRMCDISYEMGINCERPRPFAAPRARGFLVVYILCSLLLNLAPVSMFFAGYVGGTPDDDELADVYKGQRKPPLRPVLLVPVSKYLQPPSITPPLCAI